jgi:hypothetical protein
MKTIPGTGPDDGRRARTRVRWGAAARRVFLRAQGDATAAATVLGIAERPAECVGGGNDQGGAVGPDPSMTWRRPTFRPTTDATVV